MSQLKSRESLDKTGVTIRDADEGDAVAGVVPRWVTLPETVEEISAVLRVCAEQDLALAPVGGGTKLHWGRPPERCDVLLDLCCLNEILEHASGDLVVRAQAGVTMDALTAALAAEGQELALDAAPGATVGGTLATATAGPRSFRYGTPRDLLIGITVVLADGTIARSGGKVVKNVAGYDLGKLFTGSYGTLGVIAEATFRLHPLPADRRWLVTRVAPERVRELAVALAASQAEPSAVEIDRPDPGGPVTVAALVEGSAADLRALALREVAGGEVAPGPPPWWGLLPDDEPPHGTGPAGETPDAARPAGEVLVEVRFPPNALNGVLDAARDAGFRLRGSPVSGRLHLAPVGEVTEEALAAAVAGLRERVAVVTVPASPYERVERWGPVGALPLMRRVKERFDPGRRMSPGRFVGGI
ncbi:FAD-binding oxidoreductase [Nonomuraea cavernae]|uniref:FAD-linked oxidase n=1 Tax=Nonomuraea cavernae TaxID=2045107 RepID=A0A917YW98_9ACTN|nr:FAD-binding oxidoreductase [Nonomuraea cavernae]MCA2185343.1 FAD-binding oxidoreductase [Nonomuraea cavernae]GGO66176.1 FAD-linked oxidase [Nonomuraea cavernae]